MRCHPATPVPTSADEEEADIFPPFFKINTPLTQTIECSECKNAKEVKNGREKGAGGRWEVRGGGGSNRCS